MSRSHLRFVFEDAAGNAIQNALATVYQTGTTSAVSGMWTQKSGGSSVTLLTSNGNGEFEAWLDNPQTVDLLISDNSQTAYYVGSSGTPLVFASFTKTLEVYPPPAETAIDATVFHKAGTETTTGNKSHSGTETFTGATTVSDKTSATNVALRPQGTDGICYVATGGSDSNDGLSWGSAKATLQAALTAGATRIEMAGGLYQSATPTTIATSGVSIKAHGATLQATASMAGVLTIGNGLAGTRKEKIHIEGLTVDGNSKASTSGFLTNGAKGVTLVRVKGINCPVAGLDLGPTPVASGDFTVHVTDSKFVLNGLGIKGHGDNNGLLVDGETYVIFNTQGGVLQDADATNPSVNWVFNGAYIEFNGGAQYENHYTGSAAFFGTHFELGTPANSETGTPTNEGATDRAIKVGTNGKSGLVTIIGCFGSTSGAVATHHVEVASNGCQGLVMLNNNFGGTATGIMTGAVDWGLWGGNQRAGSLNQTPDTKTNWVIHTPNFSSFPAQVILPNNKAYQAYDSGGTARDLALMDGSNNTILNSIASTLLNFSGSTKYTFASGSLTLADALNLALGTGTGTQIGTTTSQKLGFWGTTPVAQQANTVDPVTVLANVGLQAAGASTLNSVLPWRLEVDPFLGNVSAVNWATLVADSLQLYSGYFQSSGAQNAEINFDVVLSAGTWSFYLLVFKASDAGIYTVQLDGSSVGTADGYNAGALRNQILSITGITVATTGKKRLKLLMATKNASSTNYFGYLSHASLVRTA